MNNISIWYPNILSICNPLLTNSLPFEMTYLALSYFLLFKNNPINELSFFKFSLFSSIQPQSPNLLPLELY